MGLPNPSPLVGREGTAGRLREVIYNRLKKDRTESELKEKGSCVIFRGNTSSESWVVLSCDYNFWLAAEKKLKFQIGLGRS